MSLVRNLVYNGIKVTPLCRSLKFFYTSIAKPCVHGPCFEHKGMVMSFTEVKLLCCSIQGNPLQLGALDFEATI